MSRLLRVSWSLTVLGALAGSGCGECVVLRRAVFTPALSAW